MVTVTEVVGGGTAVDVATLVTVTGTVVLGSSVAIGCRAAPVPLFPAYTTVAAGCVTKTVVVETTLYRGKATSDVLPPMMTLYVVRSWARARAGSTAKTRRDGVNIIAPKTMITDQGFLDEAGRVLRMRQTRNEAVSIWVL